MSLSLSVTCGDSSQPIQKIAASRCLIGSGHHCDLRLDDPSIPAEHAMILIRSESTVIELLTDSLPLLVNGRSVEEKTLESEDLIQIGAYHLDVDLGSADVVERDFINFEELADLADEWMEQREQTPTDALVGELQRRTESMQQKESQTDESLKAEIEHAMEQLARLSEALNDRAERLTRREEALNEAAQSLIEAQEQVEQQILRLNQRIEDELVTGDSDDLDQPQTLPMAA